MKGLTKSEAAGEVDHYVEATGLTDKRKQYAKSLSGGMKRKLSVGIALIADSKVSYPGNVTFHQHHHHSGSNFHSSVRKQSK